MNERVEYVTAEDFARYAYRIPRTVVVTFQANGTKFEVYVNFLAAPERSNGQVNPRVTIDGSGGPDSTPGFAGPTQLQATWIEQKP
jgi:hypothetical protein